MFVTAEQIEQLTGLRRLHAQARFLTAQHIAFERRSDGRILLRQGEFNRYRRHEAELIDSALHMRAAARDAPDDPRSPFVGSQGLGGLTGLRQPAAQAKFLAARGYAFTRKIDGTVALRRDELDRRTLSSTKELREIRRRQREGI